ncbi:hypothetical protein OXX80_002846 [Metschnikowia pulcherrima]
MSLQFPPSSPVLDGPEPCYDPFKGKEMPRGRHDLPTPNPSSTVGRSSSPARHERDAEGSENQIFTKIGPPQPVSARLGEVDAFSEIPQTSGSFATPAPIFDAKMATGSPSRAPQTPRAVTINKDFNIVSPHANVMRVPLLAGKSSLTIGRSSKSCDFHFKNSGTKTDKSVSRCHVRVEYSEAKMVLECTGFNGFGVIIPRMCLVKKIDKRNFELTETNIPLVAHNVSKSVRLDHEHTEFHVSRDEAVHMPRFANILLQIGSHVLLVNPDDCDEDLTDDESAQANVSEKSAPKMDLKMDSKSVHKSDASGTQTPTQKSKTTSEASARAFIPARPNKSVLTPVVADSIQPKTPKKIMNQMFRDEPTPSKPHRMFQGKENASARPSSSSKSSATPLSARSTNIPEISVKKRAQSEEPQGSVKKARKSPEHDENGELIIDETCLDGVGNTSEIENILVNHLAFSRLSSTPASFLNTISAVVAKLSLQQLRVVLHKTSCIGVIYRQGKDAAGKPLEEEYYYIPEKDRDPERNRLVSAVKGHGGLRACRKTHKQYYWKKPAPIKK